MKICVSGVLPQNDKKKMLWIRVINFHPIPFAKIKV